MMRRSACNYGGRRDPILVLVTMSSPQEYNFLQMKRVNRYHRGALLRDA